VAKFAAVGEAEQVAEEVVPVVQKAGCAGRGLLRVQHLVLYIGAFRISLQNRHC